MKQYRVAGILCLAVCLAPATYADIPDPDPERFASEIAAFTSWDSKNAYPADANLFVGSSSIRLWATAAAFPDDRVINRGFGGAELSDVSHFYDQVIAPYAPARIFLYAGDNDVEAGKSADQVFEDYVSLVQRIRTDFPEANVVFISIKPSKARWLKWPIMVEANELVREYVKKHPSLDYADLATPLLNEDGEPGDYYVDDGLHLNERGYALWQVALAEYLD